MGRRYVGGVTAKRATFRAWVVTERWVSASSVGASGRRSSRPCSTRPTGCTLVDVISPRDADAVRALCEHPDVDLVAVHAPPFLHPQCVDRRARRRQGRPLRQAVRHVDRRRGGDGSRRARRRRGRAPQLRVPPPPRPHRAALPAAGRRDRDRRAHPVDRVRRRLPRPDAALRLAVRPPSAAAAGSARGAPTSSTSCAGPSAISSTRARACAPTSPSAPTPTARCTPAPRRTASPRCSDRHRRVGHHRHHLRGGQERAAARRRPRVPTARSSRSPTGRSPCATPRAPRRCSRSTRRARTRTWCRCAHGPRCARRGARGLGARGRADLRRRGGVRAGDGHRSRGVRA